MAEDLLSEQASKNNKRAKALLEMYHFDFGIRNQINESELSDAQKEAMLKAWDAHIQSASSPNEMFTTLTQAEQDAINSVDASGLATDTLTKMMSDANDSLRRVNDNAAKPVDEKTGDGSVRSVVNVKSDEAPMWIEGPTGEYIKLASGKTYQFDTTDSNNVIAYSADGSKRIGKVYRDNNGNAFTGADLMGVTNGFTVTLGSRRVGSESQKKQQPQARQQSDAPRFKNAPGRRGPYDSYTVGETVSVDGVVGVVQNITNTYILVSFGNRTDGTPQTKRYGAEEVRRVKKVDVPQEPVAVSQEQTQETINSQVDSDIEDGLKSIRNKIKRKNGTLREDAAKLGKEFIELLNKALDTSITSNDRYDAISDIITMAAENPDNKVSEAIYLLFDTHDTSTQDDAQEQKAAAQTPSEPEVPKQSEAQQPKFVNKPQPRAARRNNQDDLDDFESMVPEETTSDTGNSLLDEHMKGCKDVEF